MTELKLELESSYHTSSGTIVQIVGKTLIPPFDTVSEESSGVYFVAYSGDNDFLYDCHGHALEQLRSDNTIFKPEDLTYPYGGNPSNSSNQEVLSKIAELKELVEASGFSVEVTIK